MGISDEDLFSRFSESVGQVRLASNEGLNGIVTAALIIWSADSAKATLKQINKLVLGERPSSLLVARYNRGKALARYWKMNGLPENVVKRISSFEAARNEAVYWLARRNITRQDEINRLWGVTTVGPSIEERKLHQLVVAIVNACTGNWDNGDLRAGDVAAAIVSRLPIEEAEEFCMAATEALSTKVENK